MAFDDMADMTDVGRKHRLRGGAKGRNGMTYQRKTHGNCLAAVRAFIADDPLLGGIDAKILAQALVGVGIVYAAIIAITAFIGWW